jgi:hypothetical protein
MQLYSVLSMHKVLGSIPSTKKERKKILVLEIFQLDKVKSFCLLRANLSQALAAHTYNPSYSGGRDQEDCGLGAPGQIVLQTLS